MYISIVHSEVIILTSMQGMLFNHDMYENNYRESLI